MTYEDFQEELFNYCLRELESPDSIQTAPLTGTRNPSAIPDSVFQQTQPPNNPFLLAQTCINCRRSDVIKLMKSGIFHNGGLQGNKGTVYFFKDLVFFILSATRYIISEKPETYIHNYTLAFDRTINQIDRLELIASYYNSKRCRSKLIIIKKGLEDIKSYLLSKPIALPPHKKTQDTVDRLIRLFKQQLPPKASDTRISIAISTLLGAFNLYFEPEAIRLRITRAKQK